MNDRVKERYGRKFGVGVRRMEELLECPFCGAAEPSIWKRDDGWAIKCVNGCTVNIGGYISRAGALKAWNRRPVPGHVAGVVREVMAHVAWQRQHRGSNHPAAYWMAILMEEVGEAAKGVVEYHLDEACAELMQVAAVAINAAAELAGSD